MGGYFGGPDLLGGANRLRGRSALTLEVNLGGHFFGGPDLLGGKLAGGQISTQFGSKVWGGILGGGQICWGQIGTYFGSKFGGMLRGVDWLRGGSALTLELNLGRHLGGWICWGGESASIGLLPLILITRQMKMSYKGLKGIRIDFIKIRSKMCSFNANIGLLPLILIVLSNEDEL